jgi:hypothetical protein
MPWVHHPIQVRGLKGREKARRKRAPGVSRGLSGRVVYYLPCFQAIGLRPQPWALFYRPFRPDLLWFESLAVKA